MNISTSDLFSSAWSTSAQNRRYSSMCDLRDDQDEQQKYQKNGEDLGFAIGAAATATAAAIALLVKPNFQK